MLSLTTIVVVPALGKTLDNAATAVTNKIIRSLSMLSHSCFSVIKYVASLLFENERERERQVYLQPDGLDSNTYNTYNINIIKYLQYGRHTGTTNICLLPIVQSPWY